MAKSSRDAHDVFRMFHGVEPTEAVRVVMDTKIPRELVVLGRALAVEYQPLTGRKEGKAYRHEFGDTGARRLDTVVYLCTDKSRKRYYLVPENPTGRYPVTTERGIVG